MRGKCEPMIIITPDADVAQAEPTLDEAEYCDCLMPVLQVLQQRERARLKEP